VTLTNILLALAPYVAGLLALLLLLFVKYPDRVKGFVNLFLAFEAKHAEIKAAEKAGKAPPHVHGLTISADDEIRAQDVAEIISKRKRHSKEKP
jgi:hypothetical protein